MYWKSPEPVKTQVLCQIAAEALGEDTVMLFGKVLPLLPWLVLPLTVRGGRAGKHGTWASPSVDQLLQLLRMSSFIDEQFMSAINAHVKQSLWRISSFTG